MRPPVSSGTVFVKDTVDVWNKELAIGNAELAARLGSPMTFDRRGTVVHYDDFESSPLKWGDASVGGSVTLSNDFPMRGDGCMKLVAPITNGQYARAQLFIGGLATGRMGTEFTLRMETDVKALVGVYMRGYTGSRTVHSGISIQGKTDGGLKYLSNIDPTDPTHWTTFDDSFETWTGVSYPMKFVVDFDNEEYVRCMFCGEELDMSAYSTPAVASTYPRLVYWQIVAISIGAIETSYIDNCILTIGEPE